MAALELVCVKAKHFFRALFYPGLDLHTRNRAVLSRFWKSGRRDVLDAGSGNGYFAWLAYKSGARVVALNFDVQQVQKANEFLIDYKKADPARLQIEQRNLYDLENEVRIFDEIICFEVLEHLKDDERVVRQFYRILRPGGLLHVCCPYARHGRHQAEVLDRHETGGHVRAGYTREDYRRLLEPVGFSIEEFVGIGPPAVYRVDKILRYIRNRFGDILALPLLPLALPVVWAARINPTVPFSLYVRASKRGD
jgi:SAM-dependent methyltransferase